MEAGVENIVTRLMIRKHPSKCILLCRSKVISTRLEVRYVGYPVPPMQLAGQQAWINVLREQFDVVFGFGDGNGV
jgi:hypothetical protein